MVFSYLFLFFFQAEDGIRDGHVTGVQTCALPISGCVKPTTYGCVSRSGACASPSTIPMRSRRSPGSSPRRSTCSRWNRSEERRVGKEGGAGRGMWGGRQETRNVRGRRGVRREQVG